ncbi:hypothetical protein EVAR_62321_1 [Eumeta japonica]|uniref:Uncharacterized protein n=1 Tax=Eumeta variegata TaxID=151549 RepID=A0A4C1ZI60_EUMVA|nr:hypothetical protein EVAR_62321_1 [Eumeta japonica]
MVKIFEQPLPPTDHPLQSFNTPCNYNESYRTKLLRNLFKLPEHPLNEDPEYEKYHNGSSDLTGNPLPHFGHSFSVLKNKRKSSNSCSTQTTRQKLNEITYSLCRNCKAKIFPSRSTYSKLFRSDILKKYFSNYLDKGTMTAKSVTIVHNKRADATCETSPTSSAVQYSQTVSSISPTGSCKNALPSLRPLRRSKVNTPPEDFTGSRRSRSPGNRTSHMSTSPYNHDNRSDVDNLLPSIPFRMVSNGRILHGGIDMQVKRCAKRSPVTGFDARSDSENDERRRGLWVYDSSPPRRIATDRARQVVSFGTSERPHSHATSKYHLGCGPSGPHQSERTSKIPSSRLRKRSPDSINSRNSSHDVEWGGTASIKFPRRVLASEKINISNSITPKLKR